MKEEARAERSLLVEQCAYNAEFLKFFTEEDAKKIVEEIRERHWSRRETYYAGLFGPKFEWIYDLITDAMAKNLMTPYADVNNDPVIVRQVHLLEEEAERLGRK